nr:hypothetical protein [Tanacetum cinerariifolium]
SCSDVVAFSFVILSLLLENNLYAYDCYVNIMRYECSCLHRDAWQGVISNDLLCLRKVALCKFSSTGRPLGAYNLGVATPIALVYAGLMTSEDARSWYMISRDVKS